MGKPDIRHTRLCAEAEALESLSKKELLSMLKFGADRIFANAEGKPPTDAELDALIDRSAKVAATAGGRCQGLRVLAEVLGFWLGLFRVIKSDAELEALIDRSAKVDATAGESFAQATTGQHAHACVTLLH